MRIASGMSADEARQLRNDWAMPQALKLGITPAEAMRGYTEATKVGILDDSAKAFVELSQRLAASFEMPVTGSTKSSARSMLSEAGPG